MRKADSGEKKGDKIEETQRSTPPPSLLLLLLDLDRRCKETEERAEHSPALGERPEPCRLFAINFFWKPVFFFPLFLFIVDQPVRERERGEGERASEKVRRVRASGGALGEIAAQSCLEHQPHSRAHSHPRAHSPSRDPSPGPPVPRSPGPGSHRHRLARQPRGTRAPRAPRPPPSRPPRAPGRERERRGGKEENLLRVPARGYAIWTCNCQRGI